MSADLALALAAHRGVLTTRLATALGLTDKALRGLVASGDLMRVRSGAFVDGPAWRAATPEQRLRLTTAAVLAARPRPTWAAAHAGLAVHELPLHGVDFTRVDLAATIAKPERRPGVRLGRLPEGEPTMLVRGVPVCSVATCIVQTAAASGVAAGLVAADAAFARSWTSRPELIAAAERVAPRRGVAAVRRVIALADGRTESPGETLTRLILLTLGLDFVPQAEIRSPNGEFVARVDFLVGDRVVVEFDGAVKYAGADGRDALVREKRREDRLRALGYVVVRLTWRDLGQPELVARMIRVALNAAA